MDAARPVARCSPHAGGQDRRGSRGRDPELGRRPRAPPLPRSRSSRAGGPRDAGARRGALGPLARPGALRADRMAGPAGDRHAKGGRPRRAHRNQPPAVAPGGALGAHRSRSRRAERCRRARGPSRAARRAGGADRSRRRDPRETARRGARGARGPARWHRLVSRRLPGRERVAEPERTGGDRLGVRDARRPGRRLRPEPADDAPRLAAPRNAAPDPMGSPPGNRAVPPRVPAGVPSADARPIRSGSAAGSWCAPSSGSRTGFPRSATVCCTRRIGCCAESRSRGHS